MVGRVALVRSLGLLTLVFLGLVARAEQIAFAPARSWAVVVGATEYQRLSKLRFADRDAAKVAETLVGSFGFSSETVTLLNDRTSSVHMPTRTNILAALNSVLGDAKLSRGDLFVFYFSGHGLSTPRGDFLCPVDADPSQIESQGLAVRDLVARIVAAGLKNVLIVTDACREGAANPFGSELIKLGKTSNLAILMGCQPGEKSYEYPQYGSGIFTHTLCRQLLDARNSDSASGSVWASAVATKVALDVRDITRRDYGARAQVPYVFGDRAQDVLLGVRWKKSDSFFAAFKSEAEQVRKVDRRLLVQMYERAGVEAGMAGDYVKAAEMLATVERLGEASPIVRLTLGLCYIVTNQQTQASRIIDALAADPTGGLYQSMAVRYSISRKFSVSEKAEAARQVFRALKTSDEAEQYWTFLDVVAAWPPEKLDEAEAEIRATVPAGSYIVTYLDVRKARIRGTYAESLKAINKGLELVKKDKNLSHRDAMLKELYLIYRGHKEDERAQKIVQLGLKLGVNSEFWRSQLVTEDEDAARLKSVRTEFTAAQSVETKLLIVRRNGDLAAKLLDLAQQERAKYPTSTAAILTELVCIQAGDWSQSVRLSQAALKYGSSTHDVSIRWADLVNEVLEWAEVNKTAKPQDAERIHAELVALIWPHMDHFSEDVSYWAIANRVMSNRHDPDSMVWVARKYGLAQLRPEPSYTLVQFMIDAAVQAGDEALLRQVAALKVREEEYLVPPKLRLALVLATTGRNAESRKLLAELPKLQDRTSQEFVSAVDLLNRCVLDEKTPTLLTDLMAAFQKNHEDITAYTMVVRCSDLAIADQYVRPVGWKTGVPEPNEKGYIDLLNRFLDAGETSMMPKYPDVHAWSLSLPLPLLERVVNLQAVEQDKFKVLLPLFYRVDPYLSRLRLRQKGVASDYTGERNFDGTGYSRDGGSSAVKIHVKVEANGRYSARLERGGKTLTTSGTVNANGVFGGGALKGRLLSDADFALIPTAKTLPWECRWILPEGDSIVFLAAGPVTRSPAVGQ